MSTSIHNCKKSIHLCAFFSLFLYQHDALDLCALGCSSWSNAQSCLHSKSDPRSSVKNSRLSYLCKSMRMTTHRTRDNGWWWIIDAYLKISSISVSALIRYDMRAIIIHVVEFLNESRGIILRVNYPEWNILNRIYDMRARARQNCALQFPAPRDSAHDLRVRRSHRRPFAVKCVCQSVNIQRSAGRAECITTGLMSSSCRSSFLPVNFAGRFQHSL